MRVVLYNCKQVYIIDLLNKKCESSNNGRDKFKHGNGQITHPQSTFTVVPEDL